MRKPTRMMMMAIMALAIAFASCSKDKDIFDPVNAQINEHESFKQAFIQTFGNVNENVDWGFNESTTTRRAERVISNRTLPATAEEILLMTYSEILELSEADKRACLRQLADADLVTQVDIRCLRAYGFKRIIAEDLNVSGGDFDYNDVVFDAKRVEDAGTGNLATYYIILRATGAYKRIVVGNEEGKFEVHEAFGVKQKDFVNTVGKDRGTDTGAYWDKNHAPVFIKLKVAKTENGTEPLLIDIPIYAEGNSIPLTAVKGQPAEKMCVDTDYSWLEERKHMQTWYPTFEHYVSGTAGSEGDTYVSETSWWHYSYWDGEDYATPVDDEIPADIVKEIEKVMPIYRGKTNMSLNGAYYLNPCVGVYCSDNYVSEDQKINSGDFRFSNYKSGDNTITVDLVWGDASTKKVREWMHGDNVFISGSGKNFTLSFTSTGFTYDSKTKMAYVLSGTKQDNGIGNVYIAFVMLESSKPSVTMKVGEFRSYRDRDRLSMPKTWIWGDYSY